MERFHIAHEQLAFTRELQTVAEVVNREEERA